MNYTDPKELVIVVDEKDNIVDYLPRKEAHDKKLLHRTTSMLVFNDQGQILLQKSSMKKDSNPGKWTNAAGGHVGKDETYPEAAQREIKEELNLNADLQFFKKMVINDPAHITMTSIYSVNSQGPFKLSSEEIDEVKFFSKEELPGLSDQLTEGPKIILKEYGF